MDPGVSFVFLIFFSWTCSNNAQPIFDPQQPPWDEAKSRESTMFQGYPTNVNAPYIGNELRSELHPTLYHHYYPNVPRSFIPDIPTLGSQNEDPDAKWNPSSVRPTVHIQGSVSNFPQNVDLIPILQPSRTGFDSIDTSHSPLRIGALTVPPYGLPKPMSSPSSISSEVTLPLFKIIPFNSQARSNEETALKFPKKNMCFCFQNQTITAGISMSFVSSGISIEFHNSELTYPSSAKTDGQLRPEFSRWELHDSKDQAIGDCLCHGYMQSYDTHVLLNGTQTDNKFQIFLLQSPTQQNTIDDEEMKNELDKIVTTTLFSSVGSTTTSSPPGNEEKRVTDSADSLSTVQNIPSTQNVEENLIDSKLHEPQIGSEIMEMREHTNFPTTDTNLEHQNRSTLKITTENSKLPDLDEGTTLDGKYGVNGSTIITISSPTSQVSSTEIPYGVNGSSIITSTSPTSQVSSTEIPKLLFTLNDHNNDGYGCSSAMPVVTSTIKPVLLTAPNTELDYSLTEKIVKALLEELIIKNWLDKIPFESDGDQLFNVEPRYQFAHSSFYNQYPQPRSISMYDTDEEPVYVDFPSQSRNVADDNFNFPVYFTNNKDDEYNW